MHDAGKTEPLDTARRLGQRDFYEEILVTTAADLSIDTAKSTPVATDSTQSSSPPDAEEPSELKVEATIEDPAHDHIRDGEPQIEEPPKALSILARRTPSLGENYASEPRPEWRCVLLESIDLHPALVLLYKKQGIVFPPAPPSRYLTPHGILSVARYVPIQAVEQGERLLCFAGLRLYLSALRSLAQSASIGALVYAAITADEMAEAIEIDEQILSLWLRETKAQRKAHELRHHPGADPLGLTYHDQDQRQSSELFKTCTRTLQYRAASNRKSQKP